MRAPAQGSSGGTDGAAAQIGRRPFSVRQLEIEKRAGGILLDTGRRRAIVCHRPFWSTGIRVRCGIAVDGTVDELVCSDTQIEAALDTWLGSAGNLLDAAGFRSVEQKPRYWPSACTLDLLDADGWRGEAAFLLANMMLSAIRRHVAVMTPINEFGGEADPTGERVGAPIVDLKIYAA